MKNNLYIEASRVRESVQSLEMSIHNFKTLVAYENQLEVMAEIVFGYENDKDFFNYLTGATRKMAIGKISECIKKILLTKDTQNIQLIHLQTYTDEVYELINHYPTVKKICGNPEDEAEFISMEEGRHLFKNALAHFIARQLFAYKYYFRQIVNDEMKEVVESFIERRDRTRTLHHVSWQTAKTFESGGLDIRQVTNIIFNLFTTETKELAVKARKNNLGYLQKQTEIIASGVEIVSTPKRYKKKDKEKA